MTEDWKARAQELGAQIAGRSDEEITKLIEGEGTDKALDDAFAGMTAAFLPAKAGAQSAVVQYDIAAGGATQSFQLKIAGGKCEVAKGAGGPAKVTIGIALADFFRLVGGVQNPMQLFATGKLKLQGDVMVAQMMQMWFEQPPPVAQKQ